ncbi:uncharacterized protein LOC8281636 [Ricinus communis]|uniref:Transmembrane protein n=1 Tax=Ricinus communis TaxID=3988 RepID=B9S738_RICCO|nr:uncharacterized protein LOC8281636 [Ricinus communis]EEF40617.1 conserved hypothetical protein [Ricinus communis]|eukprot:XP_002521807.1 uncharacterized protein LOC8281636 [Ricinus communis]
MYKNKSPHSHDPTPLLSNPKPSPSLLTSHDPDHHHRSLTTSVFSPLRRIMLAAPSWLRMRRSRCVFLLLCSPILLPFLCASFPLLCAAELCIRICRRARRRKDGDDDEDDDVDGLRRCEEGFRDCGCSRRAEEEKEVGLLQRYLEDQLRLVGSVYECGDEFDDQQQENQDITQNTDFRTPLLA